MTIEMPRAYHALPQDQLPSGRWHGVMWTSDRPVQDPGLYPACVTAFDRTGLWPVLIPHDAMLAAQSRRVLVDWAIPRPRAEVQPWHARKPAHRVDPLAEAANTGSVLTAMGSRHGEHHLGLVEVRRPAEVPGVLGWGPGGASSVLADWEERFGATLVVLGADTLLLSVSSPPTTLEQARAVAAEHRAFREPQADLRSYAASLVRTRRWRFRWS